MEVVAHGDWTVLYQRIWNIVLPVFANPVLQIYILGIFVVVVRPSSNKLGKLTWVLCVAWLAYREHLKDNFPDFRQKEFCF